MAIAILTLKIMPEGPDTDMEKVYLEVEKKVIDFAGDTERKKSIEPIAFGLKALKVIFVFDEAKGGADNLEKEIGTIDGVQSVEVTDIRRAIG